MVDVAKIIQRKKDEKSSGKQRFALWVAKIGDAYSPGSNATPTTRKVAHMVCRPVHANEAN